MRFSSDQQFYCDQSKPQENNKKDNQVGTTQKKQKQKKQKKQTMLSKFLDSIDGEFMKKMLSYEKLKKPVFERRNITPQKITLYEDILFITIFKQNQQKIQSDPKHFKTLCLDLQSRTKRKQCTIKERIQKKLCKMRKQQILQHIVYDKDISFNKKQSMSNTKIQSTKNIQNQTPPVKKQNQIEQNKNINNQIIEQENIVKEQFQPKSDQKSSNIHKQMIFEEQEKIDNKKEMQIQRPSIQNIQLNPKKIMLILNKNNLHKMLPKIINIEIVQKQVERLKQEKKKAEQREYMINILKTQMQFIEEFKKNNKKISPEIQQLIQQAQKITRILGLVEEKKNQNQIQVQVQVQNNKNNKKVQQTADKVDQVQNVKSTSNPQISEFNMIQEQKPEQYQKLRFSLCQNDQYIKLYKSDPQIFQPLLWSQDQDQLIESLINDFDSNQSLFKLLIKYKGPQMFVERCVFLKKNIKINSNLLFDALMIYQPLNINRFNSIIHDEKKQNNNQIQMENVMDKMENQKNSLEELMA